MSYHDPDRLVSVDIVDVHWAAIIDVARSRVSHVDSTAELESTATQSHRHCYCHHGGWAFTTCATNKHEALRQLRGWSRTRMPPCIPLGVMKAGAVWWHLVQEQRNRAWLCCYCCGRAPDPERRAMM